jgi:uncharacterized protein (TIGR00645 family)
MSDQRTTPPSLSQIERGLESVIFNSRWLMVPFYIGLALSLAVLLLKFLMMLWDFILNAAGSKDADIILGVLSLIEVTLIGNLILIVMFSGAPFAQDDLGQVRRPQEPAEINPEMVHIAKVLRRRKRGSRAAR